MTKITASVLAASLLALGLYAAPAQALNTRSFISANGLDTNACTRPAPCRTLQKAHDSTSPGGEINMLDPAGYGTVIITKAISIVNDGVGSAGILVPSGGTGITVSAGAADAVNLRGLIIEGAGIGANGIVFNTGANLMVQNSVIRNLTNRGIQFSPNQSSSLAVSDTLIADNGGRGIIVLPSGNVDVKAVFNRVEVHNNIVGGITVDGTNLTGGIARLIAFATDSVSAGSPGTGFQVNSAGAISPTLWVVRCAGLNNGVGVEVSASSSGVILLAQSTITGNTTGVSTAGGSGLMFSYGDNYISFNGSDGTQTLNNTAKN